MDYFSLQTDINEEMRAILVDWLVEVKEEYKLNHCTLHLAIILMDKYLSLEKITRGNLQAVGITSLVLASKMEEVYSFAMDDAAYICDNTYTKNFLIETELNIIKKLGYRLYYETLYQYIKISHRTKMIDDNDLYFSIYISYILLMTIDYNFIATDELANKIIEFTLVLKMEPKIMNYLINNDIVYSYIYLSWLRHKNSSYKAINEYFSKNVFNQVSLKNIPIIVSNYDAALFKFRYKNPSNEMDIENDSNTNVYPKEIFDKKITGNFLGSGTYGSVYITKLNEKNLALKKIKCDEDYNGVNDNMLREINSLMLFDHPNIIKMDGFYYNPLNVTLYIGFEYMDYTLDKCLKKPLSDQMKFSYIKQLLMGLDCMHKQNIMHRDLSAGNILISKDGILKISDFGLSRYYRNPLYTVNYTKTICTLYFRPIEILLEHLPYSMMVDIWSCACLIGYILKGDLLFDGDDECQLILSIFKTLGTPTENDNSVVLKWKGFQNKYPVWSKTGFSDLEKKYPLQTNILYKMLEYDPEKRINASEALKLFEDSFTSV